MALYYIELYVSQSVLYSEALLYNHTVQPVHKDNTEPLSLYIQYKDNTEPLSLYIQYKG